MAEPLYEAEVLGRRVLSRADRAYFAGEIVVLPLSEAEELERRGIVFVLDLASKARPTSQMKAPTRTSGR